MQNAGTWDKAYQTTPHVRRERIGAMLRFHFSFCNIPGNFVKIKKIKYFS